VHYGVDQALKNGSVALGHRRPTSQAQPPDHVKNFFSNEDLRRVGRGDTSLAQQKSPALKRMAQSHDSLNLDDDISRRDTSSKSRSRDEVSVQTDRQQHLGNIDISNRPVSSQNRLSRSTDNESPSSTKTGQKKIQLHFLSTSSDVYKNSKIVPFFKCKRLLQCM
jgi:hypothetical protein